MVENLVIYIATHKEFMIPQLEGYYPISVGTTLRDGDNFGYISDGMGENISEKNRSFCELTALYWIWKNSTADNVGLVHYRRFFSKYFVTENTQCFLKIKQAKKILCNYDIILPEQIRWKYCTVAEGYAHGAGYKKDLDVIRDIIKRKYPTYVEAFNQICKGHRASYCNMFVTRKSIMDKYCEWLFDILFEAERIIDISNYDMAEQRIFGYLSEILLNVWVLKNHLKAFYMPVVLIVGDKSRRRKIYSVLEHLPFGRFLIRVINDYEFNKAQRW